MKVLLSALCMGACAAALAQQPAATPPRKAPFEGFGDTMMDRRPEPKSSSSSSRVSATPSSNRGGTALDQRPPGAKLATPPSVSTLPPLAPSRGLNFEAKSRTAGGSNATELAGGDLFPVIKTTTYEHSPDLELRVRNFNQDPDHARFDWYFIAQDVRGGPRFVWDQGQRELIVPGAGERVETIESAPVKSRVVGESRKTSITTHGGNPSLGPQSSVQTTILQSRDGARPVGWIVRMFVDGALAKVQASSHQLELLGRDPAQLADLLKRSQPPGK